MNPEQTMKQEDDLHSVSDTPIDKTEPDAAPRNLSQMLDDIIGEALACKRDESDSGSDDSTDSSDSDNNSMLDDDIHYKVEMLTMLVDSHSKLVSAFADLLGN